LPQKLTIIDVNRAAPCRPKITRNVSVLIAAHAQAATHHNPTTVASSANIPSADRSLARAQVIQKSMKPTTPNTAVLRNARPTNEGVVVLISEWGLVPPFFGIVPRCCGGA
jgi:hypothetical protein